jgi:hypothetical protein
LFVFCELRGVLLPEFGDLIYRDSASMRNLSWRRRAPNPCNKYRRARPPANRAPQLQCRSRCTGRSPAIRCGTQNAGMLPRPYEETAWRGNRSCWNWIGRLVVAWCPSRGFRPAGSRMRVRPGSFRLRADGESLPSFGGGSEDTRV